MYPYGGGAGVRILISAESIPAHDAAAGAADAQVSSDNLAALEKLPSEQFGQPVVATSLTSHTHKTCSGLPRLPSRRSLNTHMPTQVRTAKATVGHVTLDCQVRPYTSSSRTMSSSPRYSPLWISIITRPLLPGSQASVCGHKGYRWIDWWPGVAPGRR